MENYRGFSIYRYIDTYYALPNAQAPFSLISMLLGKYRPTFSAAAIENVKKQIDAYALK